MHAKEGGCRVGFVGGISGMKKAQTANQTGGEGTLLVDFNVNRSPTIRLGVSESTTISQPEANNAAINTMLSVRF